MAVNGISSSNNAYGTYKTDSTKKAEKEKTTAENIADETTAAETDVVKTKQYTPDENTVKAIYDAQRNYIKGMQNMVNQMLEQAGSKVKATFADGDINPGIDMQFAVKYSKLLVKNEDGSYGLDPTLSADEQATLIAKAKEDVGEDGYFGVKNTSERILGFAKAITGGDPAKIDEMQKMFQKAFDEVKAMFGGELPEISSQTYDAVLKGFDEWRTASSVSAE